MKNPLYPELSPLDPHYTIMYVGWIPISVAELAMKSCKSVHSSLNSPLAVLLKGMMRALGSDLLFPLVPAAGSKLKAFPRDLVGVPVDICINGVGGDESGQLLPPKKIKTNPKII